MMPQMFFLFYCVDVGKVMVLKDMKLNISYHLNLLLRLLLDYEYMID